VTFDVRRAGGREAGLRLCQASDKKSPAIAGLPYPCDRADYFCGSDGFF
jgi:hypothetical protein